MGYHVHTDRTGMDRVGTDSKGKCGYSRYRDTIVILEGGGIGDIHLD